MNFALTPEQAALRAAVADFLVGIDREDLDRCERESSFPLSLYREVGARGWAGIVVPREYGGLGLGAVEMALVFEEFGTVGLSVLTLTLHGEKMLMSHGTPEQKIRYLPALARGEALSAIVISEPEVGSSFKRMATEAQKHGPEYSLNGHKTHINLGAEAQVLLVFCKTEAGLTALLVDGDSPGIRREKTDPIGFRLEPTYDLYFEDCRVPESQLLGEEGRGLEVFFSSFTLSRVGNASHLLGIARAAFDEGIRFAKSRLVGSRMVTEFQGIQWLLADLAAKVEAASLLRMKAAWMDDAGLDHAKETAMAKLLAIEVAESVTNKVFAVVGGHGCYRDAPFERYLRDAKVGQLAGGSAEIMRNTIAREILKDDQ